MRFTLPIVLALLCAACSEESKAGAKATLQDLQNQAGKAVDAVAQSEIVQQFIDKTQEVRTTLANIDTEQAAQAAKARLDELVAELEQQKAKLGSVGELADQVVDKLGKARDTATAAVRERLAELQQNPKVQSVLKDTIDRLQALVK